MNLVEVLQENVTLLRSCINRRESSVTVISVWYNNYQVKIFVVTVNVVH